MTERPIFSSYQLSLHYIDTWGHVINPRAKGYEDTAFRFLDRYLQLRMKGDRLPIFVDLLAGREMGTTNATGENWRTGLFVKWDVEGTSNDGGIGVDGVLLGGGAGVSLFAPAWEPAIWEWSWGALDLYTNYRRTIVESTMDFNKALLCVSFNDPSLGGPCTLGGRNDREIIDVDLTDVDSELGTTADFFELPKHQLGLLQFGSVLSFVWSRLARLNLHADGVMMDGTVVMKPTPKTTALLQDIPEEDDDYNLRDGEFALVRWGGYGSLELDLSLVNIGYAAERAFIAGDLAVLETIESGAPLPFDLRITVGGAIFALVDEQEIEEKNVVRVIKFYQASGSANLVVYDNFFEWFNRD